MTPEGLVKKKVLKQLKADYTFMPVQSGYGKRGLDIFACVHGRFIGIECKRKGVRESTKLQRITMDEIKQAGGECWLVTLDEDDELEWIRQ